MNNNKHTECIKKLFNVNEMRDAAYKAGINSDTFYKMVYHLPQQPPLEQERDIEQLAEKNYPIMEEKFATLSTYNRMQRASREAFKKGYKANTVNKELIDLIKWAHKVINASVPKQAGYGAIEILPKLEDAISKFDN